MIIYGWNTKTLKQSPFEGQECVSCQSKTTHIVVSASYAHIFWIPIFPYKKTLQIVCTSCGYAAKAREVSDEVSGVAKTLKKSVRIPFYLYSGLILLFIGIAAIAYSGNATQDRYKEYIENPQADDIYTLYNKEEPTEYKYSLWKVVAVNGDSVNISPNAFQYNRHPEKLDEEDGFYDVYFTYHKAQVLSLFDSKEIKKVQRGIGFGTGYNREIPYTPEDSPDTN